MSFFLGDYETAPDKEQTVPLNEAGLSQGFFETAKSAWGTGPFMSFIAYGDFLRAGEDKESPLLSSDELKGMQQRDNVSLQLPEGTRINQAQYDILAERQSMLKVRSQVAEASGIGMAGSFAASVAGSAFDPYFWMGNVAAAGLLRGAGIAGRLGKGKGVFGNAKAHAAEGALAEVLLAPGEASVRHGLGESYTAGDFGEQLTLGTVAGVILPPVARLGRYGGVAAARGMKAVVTSPFRKLLAKKGKDFAPTPITAPETGVAPIAKKAVAEVTLAAPRAGKGEVEAYKRDHEEGVTEVIKKDAENPNVDFKDKVAKRDKKREAINNDPRVKQAVDLEEKKIDTESEAEYERFEEEIDNIVGPLKKENDYTPKSADDMGKAMAHEEELKRLESQEKALDEAPVEDIDVAAERSAIKSQQEKVKSDAYDLEVARVIDEGRKDLDNARMKGQTGSAEIDGVMGRHFALTPEHLQREYFEKAIDDVANRREVNVDGTRAKQIEEAYAELEKLEQGQRALSEKAIRDANSGVFDGESIKEAVLGMDAHRRNLVTEIDFKIPDEYRGRRHDVTPRKKIAKAEGFSRGEHYREKAELIRSSLLEGRVVNNEKKGANNRIFAIDDKNNLYYADRVVPIDTKDYGQRAHAVYITDPIAPETPRGSVIQRPHEVVSVEAERIADQKKIKSHLTDAEPWVAKLPEASLREAELAARIDDIVAEVDRKFDSEFGKEVRVALNKESKARIKQITEDGHAFADWLNCFLRSS